MDIEEKYHIILEYCRIERALGAQEKEAGFNPLIFPTMHEVIDLVNPKSILEIGFNAGNGSLAFLLCSDAKVLSIDNYPNSKSIVALVKEFGSRFNFIHMHSNNLNNLRYMESTDCDYDLIYIDAEHSFIAVKSDIKESLKYNPDYILFDDWEQEAVKTAIETFLEKIKIIKTWTVKENQASWCLTKVIK